MFIIVFKRGKGLSNRKEKLEVVVNAEFYIHECPKESDIMYIVNNLVILYMFVSVLLINLLVVFLEAIWIICKMLYVLILFVLCILLFFTFPLTSLKFQSKTFLTKFLLQC